MFIGMFSIQLILDFHKIEEESIFYALKTKPSESFVFEESTIAKNLHEDIKNTSLNTYKGYKSNIVEKCK